MRLPLLAVIVCLVATGCSGPAGGPTASRTTPGSASSTPAAGRSTATPAPTATPPMVTPAASPSPSTAPATAPASPAAAAPLVDVASRPECGVPGGTVPATGQDIVISLACQELTAYQDGVAVLSTPVTTGEPALSTPTGHYSIIRRNSPFEMVSSWPRGTVGWYAPSWVQWVLWFRADGYGIHDASWRAAYGPGTEAHGSHGCVNVPHDAMRQLFPWASNGATVDIV